MRQETLLLLIKSGINPYEFSRGIRVENSFLLFDEAQLFVSMLGLKTVREWYNYCKSYIGEISIPLAPEKFYKEWKGWGYWLGTGNISNGKRIYLSYEEARKFVSGLGLKTQKDWRTFAKTEKPDNIPSNPDKIYKNDGWCGCGDWLGTGRVGKQDMEFRSFNKAKMFVSSLGLETQKDWKSYCRSGIKPDDIPSTPDRTYSDEWNGLYDWLGKII